MTTATSREARKNKGGRPPIKGVRVQLNTRTQKRTRDRLKRQADRRGVSRLVHGRARPAGEPGALGRRGAGRPLVASGTVRTMPTGPQRFAYPAEPGRGQGDGASKGYTGSFGSGDLTPVQGRPEDRAPWPSAGKTKSNPRGYDPNLVQAALKAPEQHMTEMDPRHLHATQAGSPAGVELLQGRRVPGDWPAPSRTWIRSGNRFPVVYRDTQGRNKMLSGHHRATAALTWALSSMPCSLRSNEVTIMWITPSLRVTDEDVRPEAALVIIKSGGIADVATLDDARAVMRLLGMSEADDRRPRPLRPHRRGAECLTPRLLTTRQYEQTQYVRCYTIGHAWFDYDNSVWTA